MELLEDIFNDPVGRRRAIVAGDEAYRREKRGGSVRGLSFALSFQATGADLVMMLASRPVWSAPPEQRDFRSWAGFLCAFAQAWAPLEINEAYPLGLRANRPSDVQLELSREVADPQAARRALDRFRLDHDLAAWIAGDAALPSVWLLREGGLMLVEAGGSVQKWPLADVLRTLEELGDALAGWLRAQGDLDWSRGALDTWARRREAEASPRRDLDVLSLGVSRDRVRRWRERGIILAQPRREQVLQGLDPVRAAARMLASRADDATVADVAFHIRAVSARATPALDDVSRRALAFLADQVASEVARVQGRELARWFREDARLGAARAEPAELLQSWDVEVVELWTEPHVEAVSFWGPEHGPAILVNMRSRRNRGVGPARPSLAAGSARFTLAHEICHLLVDRKGSLPVAEVLGGSVPADVEERANAFAAELLLPEEAAAEAYRSRPDLVETLRSLTGRFGVTQTLVAWQLLKRLSASPALRLQDRAHLHRLTQGRGQGNRLPVLQANLEIDES